MTPAVQARIRQLAAEADHRRAVAEFRERRESDRKARVSALLTELVAALAQLPLDAGAWPNGRGAEASLPDYTQEPTF